MPSREHLAPTHPVVAELVGAERLLLLTHQNPDGDGLGSMLGLRLGLMALGKEVHCVVPEGCPHKFLFLPGADAIQVAPPAGALDCVVALDCDSRERLGHGADVFEQASRTVDIDHHEAEAAFADANWCDGSKAAVALMIVDLLDVMRVELTADIATCLYCGIATDTGVFRFQNTSAEALGAACRLVQAGADPCDIAQQAWERMPVAKARLLGRALDAAQVLEDGALIVAPLAGDDFARAGARPEHTDGIIDELKRIEGFQIIVLLRETAPGNWRVSMRSSSADVASVCRRFGGGGHRVAAGCEIQGRRDDVVARITGEARTALGP